VAFLLNNLFLTVFMFTVLIGTLFPLVAEAVRGVKVSVGEPFFNRMTLPMMVALLFLMGVGPALPWKRGAGPELKGKLMPGVILGLLCGAFGIGAGARSPYAVLAFTFAGFAAAVNVGEFVTGARARMRAHGESFVTALVRLVSGNRRRYGGYTAHLGIVLVALGVAASGTFKTEREATLKPGETITLAGQTVRLKQVWGREEKQRQVIGATMEVMDGNRVIGTVEPRMNYYPTSQQPVPTPQVRSSLAGDLYLNLMAFREDGSNATVKVIWEPLVSWIWAGGFVICIGAIIGMLPTRKRPVAVASAFAAGQVAATARPEPQP
jgi:cytochrome c-type biogenesis protein CcmF